MSEGYLGNQHLKKTSTPIEWNPELIQEYAKCVNDPVYFAKKYIRIVHVDRGLIPFEMYPYQEKITREITENRRVAVLTARQAGKCVINSTVIKLRNKNTGEIIETTVGDFYDKAKKEQSADDANKEEGSCT